MLIIIQAGSTNQSTIDKYGDFDSWVVEAGEINQSEIVNIKVFEGEALPDTKRVTAAIITGSHSMVSQKESWSVAVEDWIKEAYAGGVYLFGICYGHQLIADALGGRADYNQNGKEYGTVNISLTNNSKTDLLFTDLEKVFKAHECHSQSVVALPENAVRLAYNHHDDNQAYCIDNRIWGVQFHPEFDENHMHDYVDCFESELISSGLKPDQIKEDICSTPISTSLLKRFVRLVKSL
jgi:GMP synthase (glutamine-hydrolysing)